MKLSVDANANKIFLKLTNYQRAHIKRTLDLFREKGFVLPEKYLKKLSRSIWKLKADNIRLLFGLVQDEVIIVNIFIKKTEKTPKKEIILSIKRFKKYS